MTRYYPLARGFTVYSGWGPRDGAFHAGLDFGREGGSGGLPVFAAQGGTVQYAGTASGFGQWVVVDHPTADGSGTTVYGHVLPEVTVGQRVEAGQRIARINPVQGPGNGNVPPHCHFEVHNTVWSAAISGRQDPAPWLSAAAYPGETPTPTPEAPVTGPLFGIDISNHQGNLDLAQVAREGFVAVLAKASEGSSYVDPYFARNRDGARANGMTFVGYHYCRSGDPAGNARCWDRAVGGDKGIPCMLDFEDGSGNVGDYWAVRKAIEALGYRVVLSYIPRWYWSGAMGSGDLTGVGPVMASAYVSGTGYASALYPGDGWGNQEGYGGARTAILQFTDKASVAGQSVDAWAYRGTRASLDALLTGTVSAQSEEDFLMALTDKEQRELLDAARQLNLRWDNPGDPSNGPGKGTAVEMISQAHREATQWLKSRNSPRPINETALGFALEAYDAASRTEAKVDAILKKLGA